MLPTFFLAGVPKAGTTALHVALARHPDIFMSEVKEPKHFLFDGPPPKTGGPGDARTFRKSVWRRNEYEALFAAAPARAQRGESTSLYLYDPAALRRIRAAVPDARIVVLIRDPIDRAHSNWTHLWSAGLEPAGFLDACAREQERIDAGWATFWRYLDLGRYGRQLEALFSIFPREQVLVLRYRLLREAPVTTLDAVCAFLGVRTGVVREIPASNVTTHVTDTRRNQAVSRVLRAADSVEHRLPPAWWPGIERTLSGLLQREQRARVPLTPQERAGLIPEFAADIALLERVTGESFADWRETGAPQRSDLRVSGRIGTAFNSIDRPV